MLAGAGEGGRVGDFLQRRFGFRLATREHQRTDRAVDHALPEATAQRKFGNARVDEFTKGADQAREIANACRQHHLDLLAHPPRHDR